MEKLLHTTRLIPQAPEADPKALVSGSLIEALEARTEERFREMEESPFWSRFLNGGLTREEYAYFLVQTYHYVLVTPNTYQWAIETMKREPKPHYAPFLPEFQEHWKEELGHEHWLLEDLENLGYDPLGLLFLVRANPAIEAYIALSKFFTSGPAPLALLGQDFFLESLAQRYGQRIVQGLFSGKIPHIEKAIKFITGHGEADIHHMDMNRRSAQRVTDPHEKRAILITADATGWFYASMPHYYAQLADAIEKQGRNAGGF